MITALYCILKIYDATLSLCYNIMQKHSKLKLKQILKPLSTCSIANYYRNTMWQPPMHKYNFTTAYTNLLFL